MKTWNFAIMMFAASFFIGMETGGYQFIVLKVAEEYGLSQSMMGLLISVHFVAATVVPPLIGPISDRVGKKVTTALGCIFFFAGGMICCLVHSPTGFAAGIFGAGAAFGSLLTTCQAALSDAHPGEAGKYVSLFQGTLGIGCVISPLLLNYLMLHAGFSWRILFLICGSGFLMMILSMPFAEFPQMTAAGASTADNECPPEGSTRRQLFSGLICRFFIGTLAGIIIYMFCETSFTFFIDSFYTLVFQDQARSAMALSCFWAGLAIARLFASRIYRYARVVVPVLLTVSAGLMLAFSVNQSPLAAVVLAGASGLVFGPIWPFLLGMATDRFPERTGTVTGLVMLMDGGGGALAPVMIGILSDLVSLRIAFGIIGMLMATGAMLSFLLIGIHSERPERRCGFSGESIG